MVWSYTSSLLQSYCWVCLERIFKIGWHLVKLWVGKLIALSAMCSGYCHAVRWRTRLRSSVCDWIVILLICYVTASCYNNLDSMIDKYQTRWLMPSVTVWTLIVCALQAFCCDLVAASVYSWWFFGFLDVITVNIFSSVKQNFANIVGWIFCSNCFKWLSFAIAWQFAPLSSGTRRFLSTNISQGRVATCWSVVGRLVVALPDIHCYVCRWKNFENRSAFGKVISKNIVVPFSPDTVYIPSRLLHEL